MTEALLAYLLLQRERLHAREVLLGIFWGARSEDRARNCLSTALWRLRRTLEPDDIPQGTYIMTTSNGEVGFNPDSDYWLDIAAFESQVSRVFVRPVTALTLGDADELERALQLYSGELLEGFYHDWAVREREQMRSLYLRSLTTLMNLYRQHGAHDQSLICGQKILRDDPLREEIHREVIRLYLDVGQRALAIRQYEECHRILATELNIPPMPETQALYSQILSTSVEHVRYSTDGDHRLVRVPHVPLPTSLYSSQDLQDALKLLHQTTEQLQVATQLIERLIEHPDSDNKTIR